MKRHPLAAYFGATFATSWLAAFGVAAPHLLHGELLPKITGILMFPAMLTGPSIAGIVLTRVVDGRDGLHDLFSRMFSARFPPAWYLPLLIPPALILAVLLSLDIFISPAYAPNRFFAGMLFAIPAGLFEEIGWMGYAFPKMRWHRRGLAALILGLVWTLWHLPVIDYLGTATPHGASTLSFFAAFALILTAMRVLIAWMYVNTKSILLAQLMHISSTGSLVMFSPPHVTGSQEAAWYALYGLVLWLVTFLAVRTVGKPL